MVGFLYGQTEYSIGENAIHLESYVKKAVDEGFSFLSITDNNLYGSYKFYKLCKLNNIKPIIGLKTKIMSLIERDNYVLLYATSHEGLINLFKISSYQLDNGIVTDEFLIEHKKGLTLVTASEDSNIDYFIFKEDNEIINKEFERYVSFADYVYYGIMPQAYIYDMISDNVKEFVSNKNIKTLPLAKCSYLDNSKSLEGLIKLHGKKVDLEEDLKFKTKEELISLFTDNKDSFDNLDSFINSIEDDLFVFNHQLPTFKGAKGISSLDYLKKLTTIGLEKRLKNSGKIDDGSYRTRLDYEISIIDKMGYVDYMLIVFEFVSFSKKNDIIVGIRGSATGSLVCYVLGISEVDPVEYDLLFERFLNPERVSMPDIDIDIPSDRRAEVINHVKDIYGSDHIASIATFPEYSFKSALQNLFKSYQIDKKYDDVLRSLLDQEKTDKEIIEAFSSHPEIVEILEMARDINGLTSDVSTHASGIVLTNDYIENCVPIKNNNGMYQAEYDKDDLEELGLLKIDFLGLSDLSLIINVLNKINEVEKLSLKDIPLDDKLTYELLSKGDTDGVIQFNSPSFTKYLKNMKPSCFEDIVAIQALNRPGPVEFIPLYIERKNGAEFEYIHPDLEDIVKDTYGIIVYQEQIMKIAKKFCGYSLGEADVLRRAVAKKKREVLEQERVNFTTRAKHNGYSDEISNQIYDYIVKFADYGFNRSHSVAYGLLSYQMAYLKAHYYGIFMTELANQVIGSDSVVSAYLSALKKNGFNIISPNINISDEYYFVKGNDIVVPLTQIKLINHNAAKKIIDERSKGLFKSFKDVKNRLAFIDKNVLENLIKSGACDEFGTHKQMLKDINNDINEYIPQELLVSSSNDEYSEAELQQQELDSLKFNIKYDVFCHFDEYFATYKATMPANLVVGKAVNVIGVIKRFANHSYKDNKTMAFITIDCKGEYLEAVMFDDEYLEYSSVLNEKGLVLFNGTVSMREDKVQLKIVKMRKL